METRTQTWQEELANALSHGIGILAGLIFIPFVAIKAAQHSVADLLAVLLFGAGILLVYTTSTLYHAIAAKRLKEWLRIGDHIAIYFLIAGSYTPAGGALPF